MFFFLFFLLKFIIFDAYAYCSFMILTWKFCCQYMQQTNTADMLEEAVEYVKLLQKKIQVLSALNSFTCQWWRI